MFVALAHTQDQPRELPAPVRMFPPHPSHSPLVVTDTAESVDRVDLAEKGEWQIPFHPTPNPFGPLANYSSVAINFTTTEDIRILSDLSQYYSTQIDEMPMNVSSRFWPEIDLTDHRPRLKPRIDNDRLRLHILFDLPAHVAGC